jgi:L-proline amide hydrolase
MWGPSEFHCTGKLQNWNIESQLGAIDVPTLILSGEYDESTPAINEVLHRGIQDSEWVLFEESSHTPHLEATQKYLRVLTDFLTRTEAK